MAIGYVVWKSITNAIDTIISKVQNVTGHVTWTSSPLGGSLISNVINTATQWVTGSNADGTFHAHANGTDVAIRHSEEAIVNELGEEGLIRNGVFTKILGGMRKMKLRVGDIILNHKQVQELEKNGYVTSNGGWQTEIFVYGKEYKNPFIHSLPCRDVTAYYRWNFIHILSTQICKLSTFHQQKSGGYQQKTS